jgi:hypothetical protein
MPDIGDEDEVLSEPLSEMRECFSFFGDEIGC